MWKFVMIGLFWFGPAGCVIGQVAQPVCYIDISNNCVAMLQAQLNMNNQVDCSAMTCQPVYGLYCCPKNHTVTFDQWLDGGPAVPGNDNVFADVRITQAGESGRIGISQVQSPLVCALLTDCYCNGPGTCKSRNTRTWAPIERSTDPGTPNCP